MKKIIAIILSSCIVVLYVPLQTYADSYVWYSDSNSVGYWNSTSISVYSYNFNAYSGFYFSSGLSSALSQWSSALGRTVYSSNSTNSLIKVFGGTQTYLEALAGVSFDDNAVGVTLYSKTFETFIIGLTSKELYQMDSAQCYIFSDYGLSENQEKNCMIHEIGHALGWLGHSSFFKDVMYHTNSNYYTLTNRDKNHLAQFY